MLDRIPTSLYSAAAVALSLTGMFLMVGNGSPGPGDTAAVPAGPAQEVERGAAASGDASTEGLKVHGHWTIEVRDPDGGLVERREFENAVVDDGRSMLIHFLARVQTPGRWIVDLNDASSPPCRSTGGEPAACFLIEFFSSPHALTKGLDLVGNRLVLSGTTVAERTGRVSRVRTRLNACGAGILPSDCAHQNTSIRTFTQTSIDPIDVLQGQSIHVTVSISFS